MVKSMFAGVSGLRAHQSKMDIIGNNIANCNTWGYKTQSASITSSFYQTMTASGAGNNGLGGTNPSQVGYGAQIGAVDVLHTRGGYAPTSGPLHSMIDGNGFYMVGPKQVVDGSIQESYNTTGETNDGASLVDTAASQLNLTRVGALSFDGDGNLVDPMGNIAYGFLPNIESSTGEVESWTSAGDDPKIYPIVLPYARNADGTALATPLEKVKLSNITLGKDGTISGVDENKKIVYVGRLAVADVPNPNALEAAQNSYYNARENAGPVKAVEPGKGSTATLLTGGLELANVDLANEFTSMITTQRGFQANTRIITVTDEMLQDLVSLKR